MSKLKIDIDQEVKDITTGLKDIANYLITPENKDKNKSQGGNGDGQDSESDSKQDEENKSENKKDEKQQDKSDKNKVDKPDKKKDPQQELKDSLNELNDLLNQKSPQEYKDRYNKEDQENQEDEDFEDNDEEDNSENNKSSSKNKKNKKGKKSKEEDDFEDEDEEDDFDNNREDDDLTDDNDSDDFEDEDEEDDNKKGKNRKNKSSESDEDENDNSDDDLDNDSDEEDYDNEDNSNNKSSKRNREDEDEDDVDEDSDSDFDDSDSDKEDDKEDDNDSDDSETRSNPFPNIDFTEPGSQPFDYKGLHIDPKDFQDIHTAKNDENKTERELNNELTALIRQAANDARGCGRGSARMISLFEDLIKPAPPRWVTILNPYLRPDNKVNWLYNKAHKNRLTIANGGKMLFRGMERKKEQLKDLCIALDNSGSIGQDDFNRFYSVVAGFLQLRQNVRGWVCWWDTEIPGWDDKNNKPIEGEEKAYGEFKDYPSFKKIKNIGGGGTDPECALRFAKAHNCRYVLIFTDGEFEVPDRKWENQFTKILWVICNETEYKKFNPTWGIKCL